MRDIVGLYLSPPERAVVLCVDEKSQVQALDRTQPLLPMRPGQVERRTHDYKRHGTTSLFAALDIKAGTIVGKCMPRHRAAEFRKFLDEVERNVPADLDVHIVMDNYGTHKTKLVRQATALACPREACPRAGVWSREVGQGLFWGLILEAFESGVIIVMNEAGEEGIAISVIGEQAIGDAPLPLAADSLCDTAVEALDHAIGAWGEGLGKAVLDAGLGANLVEGMPAGGFAFRLALHACPRADGDQRRSGR
ncbi:MAG: IS630 family transposase [Rhodomicrobium sp.]|nr:IS630 family transposase [Rhodomicrobium sp.]